MLKTPQFFMLWFMFVAGAMAGLMVIGCIKLFGIDALKSVGLDPVTASAKAGIAMSVFYVIGNVGGRIIWGMFSDKIGRKLSLFIMFLIQGLVMLGFFQMGFSVNMLCLGAFLVGFNFGGNFALFPAITADFFGNKTVGLNYGWVFSAYGIGGIIGPLLAGHFGGIAKAANNVSAWMTAFVIAGVVCLVAAVIALALKAPNKTA